VSISNSYQIANHLGNALASGNKAFEKVPSSDPVTSAAGIGAAASVATNVMSAFNKMAAVSSSAGLIATTYQVNKFNLIAQSAALGKAINSGDKSAIIGAVVGTIGAVAGVVSAVPTPIAPYARALSLVANAFVVAWNNQEEIEALWQEMQNAFDEMMSELGNEFLQFALDLINPAIK